MFAPFNGSHLWVIRHLAGLLDVNLPAEPKLEDFMPAQHPAEKPEAEKPETEPEKKKAKAGGKRKAKA
jgi:hypothetical protein